MIIDYIKSKKQCVLGIGVLFAFSIILLLVSLYYSSGAYGKDVFLSYFQFPKIIVLNWIPIIVLLILLYLITNRLAVSCSITGILVFVLTLVNYYKLQFRDDPFLFEDIFTFSEARNMAGQYKIKLTDGMIISMLILFCYIVIAFLCKYKIKDIKIRIFGIIICLLCSIGLYQKVYCNAGLYESIENYELLTRWGETQRFISRGFLYPFIYSTQSAFPNSPEGYDKNKASMVLDKYESKDIPDDKKVHIIGIMLEAYSDFSNENIEFENDPYYYFHQIQREAYTGELITNIFAGGTISTERAFLTGYTASPSMRRTTETWVQYFKNQGYSTMGRHQCYGWFYNRKNANRNIGFDNYLYYEEGYGDEDINVLMRHGDKILIEDIISDFENNVAEGNMCFHFSVTYQNHGPYSSGINYDKIYLKKQQTYTDSEYNIMNNYFAGLDETGTAIKGLLDYFEASPEPVVVVLFGDHKPWLGDNNSVYEMLNINLDVGTEEGFFNYYTTPYVIWGNDVAETVLNTRIVGTGEKISPCFLMEEVFKVLGYQGNEWMQYISKVREKVSVIGNNAYIEDGVFTRDLSETSKEKLEEYKKVQYYWIYDKK